MIEEACSVEMREWQLLMTVSSERLYQDVVAELSQKTQIIETNGPILIQPCGVGLLYDGLEKEQI